LSSSVLYLSYDGLTDPLGQSQILPYLAGLSKKYGYQITIISAEKHDSFAKRRELIEQIIQQNNLIWQPLFYTKKPPVISTLWDVYKMRQKALLLHKKKKFSIVHCRSYITALVGIYLKRTQGIKFVFDMRGFWADERVEGGLWNLNQLLYKRVYKYFKRKEKDFLLEANYTVSLTYKAKDEIHSWPGLQHIPIQVIPCCVDTEVFFSEKKNQPIGISTQMNDYLPLSSSTLIPSYPFTISYLGSLGTWYMLDEMLEFFKRLLLKKPDAQFLFITPDDPQLILQTAEKTGISVEKLIIKKAERKEVPQLLALSHLSIFFIKPSYSKKASSPTKMGEILSMGLPVICNAGVGDADYLFSQYQPGVLVEELNVAGYDKAIAGVEEALQIPPDNLRKMALDYFALKKGVDLYHQIYQKLLH
jgi:glycosyltransferase involved in cell wall biosynthesis